MTVILLGRTTIFMVLYMKFKNYISKSRDGFKHVGALFYSAEVKKTSWV